MAKEADYKRKNAGFNIGACDSKQRWEDENRENQMEGFKQGNEEGKIDLDKVTAATSWDC